MYVGKDGTAEFGDYRSPLAVKLAHFCVGELVGE